MLTSLKKSEDEILELNPIPGDHLSPLLLDWIAENSILPFQEAAYLKYYSKKSYVNKRARYLFVFRKQEPIACYPMDIRYNKSVGLLGMRHFQEQDLTDYGEGIFAPGIAENSKLMRIIWHEIIEFFKSQGNTKIVLDYLREDSLTLKALREFEAGEDINKVSTQIEVAPFIELPDSWEQYLASINKKDRQELQRKLRRLATVPYELKVKEEITPKDFSDFVMLHRASDPHKRKFMSKDMAKFFLGVMKLKMHKWQVRMPRLYIDGKKAASALFFDNGTNLLGYNSGYSPELNYYSPGLLLHALYIKWAIEKKYHEYDFLRGSERYKFDLGATPRELFRFEIELLANIQKENARLKIIRKEEEQALNDPWNFRAS